MLVLTRRIHERIFIGPDIIITLVDIDRGKVRIGVEAPLGVFIAREEILDRSPKGPSHQQSDLVPPVIPNREGTSDAEG